MPAEFGEGRDVYRGRCANGHGRSRSGGVARRWPTAGEQFDEVIITATRPG